MRAWPTTLLALGLLAAPAAADPLPAVPVTVGGEPDLDACGGLAEVHGLDPRGANRLSVRAGPGTGYPRLDRLGPRVRLIVCEERGDWLGVVYGPPGLDCGLGSPIPDATAYRGPCRSGWVAARYVALIAG